MNKKNLLVYAVIGLLFAGTGAYVALKKQEAAPLAAATAPATAEAPKTPVAALFAESMNDTSGTRQALAQWKGKALLVNFWAPWCPPCVEEMPELTALAQENGGKTFNVIGIGIDSPSNITQFAAKLKIAYPLYAAGMSGTDLSRQFGNTAGGLPYTVLIGADGQVKKTYLGRLKFEELKADLAQIKS